MGFVVPGYRSTPLPSGAVLTRNRPAPGGDSPGAAETKAGGSAARSAYVRRYPKKRRTQRPRRGVYRCRGPGEGHRAPAKSAGTPRDENCHAPQPPVRRGERRPCYPRQDIGATAPRAQKRAQARKSHKRKRGTYTDEVEEHIGVEDVMRVNGPHPGPSAGNLQIGFSRGHPMSKSPESGNTNRIRAGAGAPAPPGRSVVPAATQ